LITEVEGYNVIIENIEIHGMNSRG
jgi:hypothetical protein